MEMISSMSVVSGTGVDPELVLYRQASVLPDTDQVPSKSRNVLPSTVEDAKKRMFCVKTTSITMVDPLGSIAEPDHLPTSAIGGT